MCTKQLQRDGQRKDRERQQQCKCPGTQLAREDHQKQDHRGKQSIQLRPGRLRNIRGLLAGLATTGLAWGSAEGGGSDIEAHHRNELPDA